MRAVVAVAVPLLLLLLPMRAWGALVSVSVSADGVAVAALVLVLVLATLATAVRAIRVGNCGVQAHVQEMQGACAHKCSRWEPRAKLIPVEGQADPMRNLGKRA